MQFYCSYVWSTCRPHTDFARCLRVVCAQTALADSVRWVEKRPRFACMVCAQTKSQTSRGLRFPTGTRRLLPRWREMLTSPGTGRHAVGEAPVLGAWDQATGTREQPTSSPNKAGRDTVQEEHTGITVPRDSHWGQTGSNHKPIINSMIADPANPSSYGSYPGVVCTENSCEVRLLIVSKSRRVGAIWKLGAIGRGELRFWTKRGSQAAARLQNPCPPPPVAHGMDISQRWRYRKLYGIYRAVRYRTAWYQWSPYCVSHTVYRKGPQTLLRGAVLYRRTAVLPYRTTICGTVRLTIICQKQCVW